MRHILVIALVAILSACMARAPAPEPAVSFRDVAVPVAVGCVVDRPAAPAPLRDRVPADAWAARAPGAKAQAVRAQAGRRLNFESALDASTVGCSPAPAPSTIAPR